MSVTKNAMAKRDSKICGDVVNEVGSGSLLLTCALRCVVAEYVAKRLVS